MALECTFLRKSSFVKKLYPPAEWMCMTLCQYQTFPMIYANHNNQQWKLEWVIFWLMHCICRFIWCNRQSVAEIRYTNKCKLSTGGLRSKRCEPLMVRTDANKLYNVGSWTVVFIRVLDVLTIKFKVLFYTRHVYTQIGNTYKLSVLKQQIPNLGAIV